MRRVLEKVREILPCKSLLIRFRDPVSFWFQLSKLGFNSKRKEKKITLLLFETLNDTVRWYYTLDDCTVKQ